MAISRYGTFSAAGDHIGLTQAAVSGQMKRLEDGLGITLFTRTGRSAILNAEGLRVLEQAKPIISMFDGLAKPGEHDMAGYLRIGAIASVQSTFLARALVPFRARFPRHHIHIIPGISLNLFDQVDAGEIDLALVIRPSHGVPEQLLWRSLVQEPYVLAVPADIGGDDWASILQQQPFIRYERGSFGGRQVDRFLKSQRFSVHESIEVDDLPTMLTLVGKRLGVAVLPLSESNLPLPPGVRTISLAGHSLFREIGMLSATRPGAVVDVLTECLLNARI